jgi:hypothetical protein
MAIARTMTNDFFPIVAMVNADEWRRWFGWTEFDLNNLSSCHYFFGLSGLPR